MRKFYGLIALTALALGVRAQERPVLFKDALEQYEQMLGNDEHEDEDADHPVEDIRYHFERWKWYWEQHLDMNGYMVPPAANFEEALKHSNRGRAKTTANQSDWKFMGPSTSAGGYRGIGRINAICFHPSDTNTYWVGAAGGGAWKTTDDGMSWTLMTGNLPRLDVSDIDINPKNPNTMYLCTGDRENSSNSLNNNYSIGVLKSLDGGKTWNPTGISWTTSQYRLTNCLIISEADTNTLVLATSNGIYRSTNGGTNWTSVLSGHFKQVLANPGNANIIYAGKYDGTREIYRSTDGGVTWNTVTNFGNASRRIMLAVTPVNSSLVRAAVCNSSNGLMGIYESTNSGASFTQIYAPSGSNCNNKTGDLITNDPQGTGCGKQGWYDLSMAISPTNSNVMFFGGVNTFGSTNGGHSWSLVNQWASYAPGVVVVHADKHDLSFHPISGSVFECNDGGVYKSVSPFTNMWDDLTNGLGITQFYRNAVTNAADAVIGGAQDNGTKGLQGGTWYELTGGDGMECQADPLDSNVFYTSSQYGNISRTTNGGAGYTNIKNKISGKPKGAWITPFIITPDSNKELIAGFKEIYYSPDRGNNWMSIQGSEITGKNCTRLAMTGGATPTIYAIFPDTQVVFYADNYVRGQTATFDTINVPYNGYISDIRVHPTDSGHFYLAFSAYNSARVAEYNKGSWSKLQSGLPNVPVRCLDYDSSLNVLYAGTDIGVYYMDTSTHGAWAAFTKNMPAIEVLDLGINYTTKEIWAATYGRGMWKSIKQGSAAPDTTTDTNTSVVVIPYADDVFNIAPNPSNGNFKIIAGPSVQTGKAIKVNIIDYTGKVVLRQNVRFSGDKAEVHAVGVPAGVYIVELTNEQAILGRRRIVVR